MEKRRSKVVEEIVAWCQEHDIELGQRLTHGRLHLIHELLAQIDETLVASGEASIEDDLGGLTSAEQARLGSATANRRAYARIHGIIACWPACPARWCSTEVIVTTAAPSPG
ncbi:MAG: hypothetical protein R6U30_14960 [Halomonas sp.]